MPRNTCKHIKFNSTKRTADGQTSNHHFQGDARGQASFSGLFIGNLGSSDWNKPSPSSQFVAHHLHQTPGRRQESRGTEEGRGLASEQGVSPCSWLEADWSLHTNCLEPRLCGCDGSLEIPYREDSRWSIGGFAVAFPTKSLYSQVSSSCSLQSSTGRRRESPGNSHCGCEFVWIYRHVTNISSRL